MPLQIIGAGLGRTGTMSTKLALEQIGFGPCFHMSELITDLSRLPGWQRAADGAPDWEAIFDGYAATVDYPACTFWRELTDYYPDAKVVLTVRDPHKWFESTQATIFSEPMRARLVGTDLEPFFAKAVWRDFADRIDDREHMVAMFERHRADVEAAIPSDRLLVYEVSEGWEPLCEFLGVPVPETPFPRTNSREELRQMIEAMGQGGGPPDIESIVRRHMEGHGRGG
ncbi:MAG: hypothetical protein JXB36_06075 [Gammaproteobacteria bacterium]|nr:hypothetical protein [Gammaproteobacteria bacterium]